MFNKNLLLLFIGLVAIIAIYMPTTNGYSICTCYCCDGKDCDPILEQSFEIASCNGSLCLDTCKERLPSACNSSSTGRVVGDCKDVSTTTITTTTVTTPTPTTTTTGPTTTTESTTPTTTTTGPTTTPSTPWPVYNTTTIITTPTTTAANGTTTTTVSSPTTTSAGNITVTITTSTTSTANITVTVTTATPPTKPATTTHNAADFLRQSSLLIASLMTSVLLISKVLF